MNIPTSKALREFIKQLPPHHQIELKREAPIQADVKGETIVCSRDKKPLRNISPSRLKQYLDAAVHLKDEDQLKTNAYPRNPQAASYFVAILQAYRIGTAEVSNLLPEEYVPKYIKGTPFKITVNRYERDRSARTTCLEKYGTTCFVCKKSLEQAYGVDAKNLIHVHHLKPQAAMRKQYSLDPINDLRPVCPNCHAVIHFHRTPENPRTIEEVRKLILRVSSN